MEINVVEIRVKHEELKNRVKNCIRQPCACLLCKTQCESYTEFKRLSIIKDDLKARNLWKEI